MTLMVRSRIARALIGHSCSATARRFCTQQPTKPQTLLQIARESSADIYGGAAATPQAAATFIAWHNAISAGVEGDHSAVSLLRPHVHDKCIFRPPTYFKPWEGGDEMLVLLGCVGEVFGSSFTYGRQWLSDDGHQWALEFKADIAGTGKMLDGIDLVTLDEEGKMVDFTVMARPPNAVDELKKQMMMRVPVKIAALKAKQALGLA